MVNRLHSEATKLTLPQVTTPVCLLVASPGKYFFLNPLTAGAAYIRVFIFYWHIKYHLLNMLKINVTLISNIWEQFTFILSNLTNSHSLEVVDRVSETQLQVGENSDWIIWRLKG